MIPAGRVGRALGALVTAAAVASCLFLAMWQWDRAHRTAADAVPESAMIPLAEVDPASSYAGMRVSVTGTFDGEHEVLVGPRMSQGQAGTWVLTPMRPAQDGPAVAVVRGWIPAGTTPAPPPMGQVTIGSVLVADERRTSVAQSAVTAGPQSDPLPTLSTVDSGALAAVAGYPLRAGWLALLGESGPGQPAPLEVADLPGANLGVNWRNAAYALQWVVFAAFAIVFAHRFNKAASQQERPSHGSPFRESTVRESTRRDSPAHEQETTR